VFLRSHVIKSLSNRFGLEKFQKTTLSLASLSFCVQPCLRPGFYHNAL